LNGSRRKGAGSGPAQRRGSTGKRAVGQASRPADQAARTGHQGREQWFAVGLLALAVAFWAGNWVIGRMIRLDAPPAGLTFARWLVAACVLLAFNARSLIAAWPVLRRSWAILLTLAVLASVLQHLPVYIGLRTTSATTASLLNATTPVCILLMGWLLLGERLRAAAVAGIGLSLVGAVWIVTRGTPQLLVHWVLEVGDLWILGGTLSWAAYTVFLRWRPAGLPPMTLLSAIAVLGALVSLPVAVVEYALGARFIWSLPVVLSIGYIGLGATVLAYICWNRGVEVLGASRAGPFMYLMPVFTPLLGWVVLGERMEAFHVVGVALIFAGIFLTRLPSLPRFVRR